MRSVAPPMQFHRMRFWLSMFRFAKVDGGQSYDLSSRDDFNELTKHDEGVRRVLDCLLFGISNL